LRLTPISVYGSLFPQPLPTATTMPAKSTETPHQATAAKPMGMTARAVQIGVSVVTLQNWKKAGVDVFDDEQVRARLAKSRSLSPDLKPEWRPQVEIAIPDDVDPTSIDFETFVKEVAQATDKHGAQLAKTKIDALLNAYKLREAAGKYVSRAKVDEDLMRIGAAVKAAMKRMESDLPQMLEGMTAAKIQLAIRSKVDEILTLLADKTSEVWSTNE
jgi:hypothetical protein